MGRYAVLGAVLTAVLPPLARQAMAELPAGQVLPLAVHAGRCQAVIPADRAGEKYYLVVGSLSTGADPHRLRLRTEGTNEPVFLPLEARHLGPASDDPGVGRPFRILRSEPEYPAASSPPTEKDFDVFVGGDFRERSGYVTVHAKLQAVGQRCQVYADRACSESRTVEAAAAEVVRTFDQEVYPATSRELGRALDVDRDGRFTVLFSPWLGRLNGGRVGLSGFVRGSDFFRDMPAPYGNRCDMLYLNADLQAGPLLRTVLAHEYTHAVVFSQHVFGAPGGLEEEGWLNEGLAHLAEERHYGWENLDYRVSAFLSAPERYRLVVPDYYAAGLYRSHGNRGATYLFLHWCAEHAAPGLAGRLSRSGLAGVANLERATSESFADLFRGWTTAMALDRMRPSTPDAKGAVGGQPEAKGVLDLRQPLGNRFICGPRYEAVRLAGAEWEGEVAGTAVRYFLLYSDPSGQSQVRLTIEADPATDLQVSIIRVPEGMVRLSLQTQRMKDAGSLRLLVTANDAGLTIDGAAWERLVPTASRPEDTSYRPGPRSSSGREWFPRRYLRWGESVTSMPVHLPNGRGPWVIKVAATDDTGHRVAAWSLVEGDPSAGASAGGTP